MAGPIRADIRFCKLWENLPDENAIAQEITKLLAEKTNKRPGEIEIVFHVSDGRYWFKEGETI